MSLNNNESLPTIEPDKPDNNLSTANSINHKRNIRYAFIEYYSINDAEKVLRDKSHAIDGTVIQVEKAHPKDRTAAPSSPSSSRKRKCDSPHDVRDRRGGGQNGGYDGHSGREGYDDRHDHRDLHDYYDHRGHHDCYDHRGHHDCYDHHGRHNRDGQKPIYYINFGH